MRSGKLIHVVSCHAEGEVGDVIVGGVAAPPGETLWQQSRWIAQDQTLRNFMLNEPRGGVFRHVNLLVPAKHPRAHMGFIIMEPEDTPPMSGSNAICVATVLLDSGILPMQEPATDLVLEAPGGLIEIKAECRHGKAERVTVRNVASFVDRLNVALEVDGIGSLTVSTAYGGDSFVIVDAAALGAAIEPNNAKRLAEMGSQITQAANQRLGFRHPQNPDWGHISFCLFVSERGTDNNDPVYRHGCVIRPGKIDRSPTGTAVSARMALLHAQGRMAVGGRYIAESIIGSRFIGKIDATTTVADINAIIPLVSGRAWITGTHQYLLDPSDPWPGGYRLADTWPRPARDERHF